MNARHFYFVCAGEQDIVDDVIKLDWCASTITVTHRGLLYSVVVAENRQHARQLFIEHHDEYGFPYIQRLSITKLSDAGNCRIGVKHDYPDTLDLIPAFERAVSLFGLEQAAQP